MSRAETHTKLLQQVILFVAEVNFTNYTDFAQFLRSLLTYTMIQNSVSTAYTCFAQRLHSLLVSLSCTHPSQGMWITFYLQQTLAAPQRRVYHVLSAANSNAAPQRSIEDAVPQRSK